jgi:hypothetical protein
VRLNLQMPSHFHFHKNFYQIHYTGAAEAAH